MSGCKIRTLFGGGQIFFCPGCKEEHAVNSHPSGPRWTYNGDAERPTFSPSVLITSGHHISGHRPGGRCWCTYNAEHPDQPAPFVCQRCHSFVREGKIQFLNDSTHELAGQTVELPDWPYAPGSYGGLDESA